MTIFQAIILGIVQGITEFLPISSQAHLFLVPYILRWDYQGLDFDIALHWGTLLAVLLVFGKDYWHYLRALFAVGQENQKMEKRMAWFLFLGSIPAALAGLMAKDLAETLLRNPLIMVVTLSAFGILLWAADRYLQRSERGELTAGKAFAVGIAQAVAIVPGVSRSGSTITAGLFFGLGREAATRFSFLLSGPIIFGAGLVAMRDFTEISAALVAGFLAAAISGFAAIKFLLRFVSRNNFNVFVWYRLLLAAVVLGVVLYR